MRIIFKILLFPLSLVLTIFVAISCFLIERVAVLLNIVLLNVSAISTEDHLIETNGKIPIDILIYLKKISEGIKNNIQYTDMTKMY